MIVQRSLAAKNLSHAKGGSLVAAYLKVLPLFLMVFPGMASRVLFPGEEAVGGSGHLSVCKSQALGNVLSAALTVPQEQDKRLGLVTGWRSPHLSTDFTLLSSTDSAHKTHCYSKTREQMLTGSLTLYSSNHKVV